MTQHLFWLFVFYFSSKYPQRLQGSTTSKISWKLYLIRKIGLNVCQQSGSQFGMSFAALSLPSSFYDCKFRERCCYSTITALRGTSFLLLPFSSSIQTRSLADFQAVCIHSLAMLPWLCVLMYFMWITHTSLPLLQQRASFPVFSSVYINPPILLKSATDPLLLWFFVLAEQKPISFAHSFCLSLLFFTHLCILVISPWMLRMW